MNQHRPITRWLSRLAALVALALVSGGCLYFPAAYRTNVATGGTAQPWFCQGTPSISNDECKTVSIQFDYLLAQAHQFLKVSSVTAAGATPLADAPPGVGSAFVLPDAPATFDPTKAQVLLYSGPLPANRLAGIAHVVTTGPGSGPPDGYPGTRDVWTEINAGTGTWMLPVWLVRGYLNHPNVFAATHPCLVSELALASTTDQCFLDSHTQPLKVLVTNDDGIGAPGIDAVVERLRTVPGLSLTLVAPRDNQSGVGDRITPGSPVGLVTSQLPTASGFVGTAVVGTPADAVLYALQTQRVNPDLVVSGINEGQNMGPIIPISGTVGAARTAARAGVPAVATSQGFVSGLPTEFPAGANATLAWLEQFRLGLAGPPFMDVANINTPTCVPGSSVRGTLIVPVAVAIPPRSYTAQNCLSTVTVINDDIDAFNQGFVGIADARRN